MNQNIPVQERDVWKEPSRNNERGFILVPANYWLPVTESLHQAGISFTVKIADVQSLISEAERKNVEAKLHNDRLGRNDINGTFPRYSELLAWMQQVAQTYPAIASTFTIGTTLENRPMQVLKLGLGNSSGQRKWRVWIDAGLHAREWLSVTTAIFVADQLVQGYASGNQYIINLLDFFDFHISPVTNPDGYEYCHTTERLWRKNRRPINAQCTGVDLNRNFNFQWGGVNADPEPCSNLYMGPYPESEIELVNFVSYILPEASDYILYHAYHTWGELFFTRWDYTSNTVPSDHQELLDLAKQAVIRINSVHGERYEAGIAPDLMYAFAGSSSDWARGVANIKYPYLTELRDFGGDYAFIAPPEEIQPCGEENWAGLQIILDYIKEKYTGIIPPQK